MASKKYQLKKLKKKIFKNNKKEKQRMMKNLCLGSIGAVSAVNVLALTGIFMPKKSKDNQELSSHVLAQCKDKEKRKRVKQVSINAHDGLGLIATVFEAENPKGLVQIVHGALEHKARYYPLMKFLSSNGYTAIISDNRGHGYSINKDNPLGYMNGMDQMIDDIHRVSLYIKGENPGLELNMIGHSLGSMLARDYLQDYDHEIQKLIISGTPTFHPFTRLGIHLGKILMVYLGPNNHSRIFNNIKSGRDWLTHNKTNIKRAEEDPLMFSSYPNIAGYTIWEINWNLKQYKKYKLQNPKLKILNIVGEDDQAITGGEEGIKDTINSLEKIGYRDIENIEYPNMKHEIFNEDNKITVYKDVLRFLNT